jgi:hypothetical protein
MVWIVPGRQEASPGLGDEEQGATLDWGVRGGLG